MISAAQAADLASAMADVARTEVLPRFRRLPEGGIATKTDPDDLVTEADRAAERALTRAIADILPKAQILGEEAASEDASVLDRVGSDQVVIIDPIDGTWNFAHGIATFGMILAVVEAGETVWGGLYDPLGDDLVEAHLGGGAWFVKGGQRQRLSFAGRPTRLSQAAGVIHTHLYPASARPALARVDTQMRRCVRPGASCHDYRLMAMGGTDLSLNGKLSVWDHAAGALVIRELGGVARRLDGADYRPTMRDGRLLVASSPALWAQAAEAFNTALGGT